MVPGGARGGRGKLEAGLQFRERCEALKGKSVGLRRGVLRLRGIRLVDGGLGIG